MRILIVAPSWIGDTVAAHPLFMRLRAKYPQARIDPLAPPWVAAVLRAMPRMDDLARAWVPSADPTYTILVVSVLVIGVATIVYTYHGGMTAVIWTDVIQLVVYLVGAVIAGVILSWLMAFGVVNPYNPTVRAIWQGLNAVTEPLLRPIRNMMPNLGAIDISPIVLLLACFFVQSVVLGSLRDLLLTSG